jgi:hypothetical protein
MIKARSMRWAVHIARMKRTGMLVGFFGKARRKETTKKT